MSMMRVFFQEFQVGDDLTYDPKVGFAIWYPNILYNGMFRCIAKYRNNTQELMIYLSFKSKYRNNTQELMNLSLL